MFFHTKKACNLCGKSITHTHTHTSLCCLLVAGLLGSLITSEALALGGIGGGRSAKARNNNGIQAIHAYVCVNLDCSQSNIKIVEKCATHAHMENGICYCDEGYLGDGETCTESLCSPGQKPDKNNEKCLNCEADEPCATCKSPFTPNGDGEGNCVCSDTSCGTGHYCSGGECQPCPANATCPSGEIVCDTGYYLDYSLCLQIPPESYLDQDSCVQSGYYWVKGDDSQCIFSSIFYRCNDGKELSCDTDTHICECYLPNCTADAPLVCNAVQCIQAGFYWMGENPTNASASGSCFNNTGWFIYGACGGTGCCDESTHICTCDCT